ncbi:hypothetical protein Tco_1015513 [Tanacetum coccineum]|uniref:DUF4219 domain-containing protein n=1 Tax=Tanacetum coccineum TaxID=301880 RepID=A0ABQ5FL14_9ASTR
MESEKYLEGQSMQRPPLFESDGFIYWKNRFETYVKSKDLDLWHVITYGDFPPIQNNPETKKDEIVPFDKQNDDLKKKLAKNNEAKMVIYNALPRKEYERIFMCKTAKEIWDTLLITHQDSRHGPSDTMHNPPQLHKVDPHGLEDSYKDRHGDLDSANQGDYNESEYWRRGSGKQSGNGDKTWGSGSGGVSLADLIKGSKLDNKLMQIPTAVSDNGEGIVFLMKR